MRLFLSRQQVKTPTKEKRGKIKRARILNRRFRAWCKLWTKYLVTGVLVLKIKNLKLLDKISFTGKDLIRRFDVKESF